MVWNFSRFFKPTVPVQCSNVVSCVSECQILKIDKPRPFTFIIRGLQMTTIVERMFAVESDAEREEWLTAIANVARKIDVSGIEESGKPIRVAPNP